LAKSDPEDLSPALPSELFRKQAIDAATSNYGMPIRPMGLAGWALTTFMVLVFAIVAIFLAMGRYARKETVAGVLQPTAGAVRIAALNAGVITTVYVSEGQTVSVGDPILELSVDRSIANGGDRLAVLSALMEEGEHRESRAIMDQARAVADANTRTLEELRARKSGLEDDIAQLTRSVALQEDRVRLAQDTLDAAKALHDRQLLSTLQFRQREEALIIAQQALSSIHREIRRNEANLLQARAEEGRRVAEAARSVAESAIAKAQFDQRQAQRQADRSNVLTASQAGRVVAAQIRPGMTVQPGRTLAIIVPPGSTLQAELWVPSRAAGFLEPGDTARLMYDAFPYQKFGVGRGTVTTVAGAPTDPSDMTVPIEASEALYRVLVSIEDDSVEGYGRRWQLTPGMRLSADLILDDRSLWEWLFDPFIAARRRAGT
jgi:membrane fusion protein